MLVHEWACFGVFMDEESVFPAFFFFLGAGRGKRGREGVFFRSILKGVRVRHVFSPAFCRVRWAPLPLLGTLTAAYLPTYQHSIQRPLLLGKSTERCHALLCGRITHACYLASVPHMYIYISQMSALLSGLGGDPELRGGGRSGGGGPLGSSSSRELADIGAVLETATAALEEIRNQVGQCRHLRFLPASFSPGASKACAVFFFFSPSILQLCRR